LALALAVVIIAGCIWPGPLPRVLMALPVLILIITILPEQGLRVSSLSRYEMVVPPVFLLIAYWMDKYLPRKAVAAVLVIALAAQVYYAYRFGRGQWVG
jgi:hypothetical protein